MPRAVKLLGLTTLAALLLTPLSGAPQDRLHAWADDELPQQNVAVTLDLKRMSPAEQRITAALDEETETGFIDTPLKDAINFLEELHKITIIGDEAAWAEYGIAGDEPINLDVSGVTLRSGLNIMLEPLRLTFVIEDDVMKITTRDKAERKLETRVYDVHALQKGGIDSKMLAELVERTIAGGRRPQNRGLAAAPGGPPGGIAGPGGDLEVQFGGPGGLPPAGKTAPERDVEWSVTPLPGCLVVKHNPLVHAEVRELLEMLHRAVPMTDKTKKKKTEDGSGGP